MDRDKTKYREWVKISAWCYAVCGPKFTKFWDNVGDPSCFPTPLLIVYITFQLADVRH